MHPKALLDACAETVRQVLLFQHPADAVVSRFVRENRLGVRERATVADTAYTVLREKLRFESLARSGMPVAEYPTKVIKKALVGTGGAEKQQIQHMLKILLPGVKLAGEDASDALAVAITHANMLGSHR